MEPSQRDKLARLNKARERLRPIMEDTRRWNNECEEVFAEFRVAVVHLRNDKEMLDAVEGKEVVWQFLCKLCRDRRLYWARCEEVLHILKGSDAWMRALVDDPQADINDLPTNVIKEFDSRCEEVSSQCSKHIRLVIVGCGPAAVRHCEVLARHNERVKCEFFQIAALVDKVPDRIAALREIPQAAELRLRDADEFDSIQALLGQNFDFDAAALLSHDERDRVLPAILARGKFVFAEPPLVTSGVEVASKLVKMSRQPPGNPLQRLLVAEPGEYAPELVAANGYLESRSIGEVFGAEAQSSWGGAEASEALANGIGCTLAPGLRMIRALRCLVGPIEEGIAAPQSGPTPSSGSRPQKNSTNPFGPPSREPAGPEIGSACIFRHKGGIVSTLKLQSAGPRLQKDVSKASRISINGSLGDLIVEGTRVFVNADTSRARPSPSTKRLQELKPGEYLWELFASQVAPIARGKGEPLGALQQSLQANPDAVAENLEAHISDLAVAEALRASFRSRCFETVQVPGMITPAAQPGMSPTSSQNLRLSPTSSQNLTSFWD